MPLLPCFRCHATPCECVDGITIIRGDCRAILPEIAAESVHAIITDPPYASGARKEAQRATSGAMVRGKRWNQRPICNDQMTTTGYTWLLGYFCLEAHRILRPGGSVLIFTDWRQWPNLAGVVESSNLRLNQMLVWDKQTMGMGFGFRNQHELIMHASRGTPTIYNHNRANVMGYRRAANKDHPSPKPVGLLEELLAVVTEPGDMILDPFMGAGATLEAAKLTGRRAIGIELDQESDFCTVAARRLEQGALFTP